MSAAVLTPRVRMMAVCDRIWESSAEPGVFDLKGVRQRLLADNLPFRPRRLWLFLLLSSVHTGEFPCYVRVVNDRTERTVFYSYLRPSPKFSTAGSQLASCASMRIRFPEEGNYTVQVWFFQSEAKDVLKGEIPFIVSAKGAS